MFLGRADLMQPHDGGWVSKGPHMVKVNSVNSTSDLIIAKIGTGGRVHKSSVINAPLKKVDMEMTTALFLKVTDPTGKLTFGLTFHDDPEAVRRLADMYQAVRGGKQLRPLSAYLDGAIGEDHKLATFGMQLKVFIPPKPVGLGEPLTDEDIDRLTVKPPPKASTEGLKRSVLGKGMSNFGRISVAPPANLDGDLSKFLDKVDKTTQSAKSLGSIRWTVGKINEAEVLNMHMMEIIETERQYVRDLEIIVNRYLKPLSEHTLLSEHERQIIFANIEQIATNQRCFLNNLEEAFATKPPKPHLVGKCFVDHGETFKMYASFCTTRPQAVELIDEKIVSETTFKQWLDARNPSQQQSRTFGSYIIKPVQRVLKYPLLLKEIEKLTNKDGKSVEEIVAAMEIVKKVSHDINEAKRVEENIKTAKDLFTRLEGTEDKVTSRKAGSLLYHITGSLWDVTDKNDIKNETRSCWCYIFEHLFVLALETKTGFKLKGLIPTPKVFVRDRPDSEKVRYMVDIFDLQKENSMTTPAMVFSMRLQEAKAKLFGNIRKAMKQAMTLSQEADKQKTLYAGGGKIRVTFEFGLYGMPKMSDVYMVVKFKHSKVMETSKIYTGGGVHWWADKLNLDIEMGANADKSTKAQGQITFHEPFLTSKVDILTTKINCSVFSGDQQLGCMSVPMNMFVDDKKRVVYGSPGGFEEDLSSGTLTVKFFSAVTR